LKDIFDQETSPLPVNNIQHTKTASRGYMTRNAQPGMPVPQKQGNTQDTRSAIRSMPKMGQRPQKIWKRRVPLLTQMNMVECGLACLAMILSYYGRPTSISELRTRCGVGRDGLSALSLVRAARNYGLKVRAVSLQESDFSSVRLPAIIHWEFKHFLVVEYWSRKYVRIVDPAKGRRKLSCAEFDAGFTGVVIMLEPDVHFDRQAIPSRGSLREYLLAYVKLNPMTLVQVAAISLVLQGFGLVLPLATKFVVDQVLPLRMDDILVLLAGGMVILVFSQMVTALLRECLLVYLRARIDIHMMRSFLEHLLLLPYTFFQQHASGDLLARMGSNTVIRDVFSNQLISTMLDSSMVTIYLCILLWQSLPFAVLTLAIGLLQVILLLCTNRTARDLASRELVAQGKSQSYMAETLVGIASLKAAGAEHRALGCWSDLFLEQLNISVRRSYFSAVVNTVMSALRSLSPLALLWMGATQVLNGSLSIGMMFALTALAAAFLTPLASLVTSGQQLQLIRAHFERLADVTSAEVEQKGQTMQSTPKLTGHIKLENVGFQYDPNAPEVLRSINLSIRAGQKVALVGRTGSGKSTLGKLLLGLYTPTEGSISYDGIPLHYLNYQEVRRQFGVVMQDSSIFSGSVLSNIKLNDPNIDMKRVIKAAAIAAIDKDINDMPMGYETFVSEGGSALSGGQRQRLAIARAVAHNPVILLLDEATSHLDVMTEQIVEKNLRSIACTQIIIAHRLSTIRNADLIVVVDHGTIVEKGSHDELMLHNGYYARLMQCQMEYGKVGVV